MCSKTKIIKPLVWWPFDKWQALFAVYVDFQIVTIILIFWKNLVTIFCHTTNTLEQCNEKTNIPVSNQVRYKPSCAPLERTRGLELWIKEVEKCIFYVVKRQALIRFAITEYLICFYVFTYEKCWFPHLSAKIVFYEYAISNNWLMLIVVRSSKHDCFFFYFVGVFYFFFFFFFYVSSGENMIEKVA